MGLQILIAFGLLLLAYALGSIPFGMIIVRLSTGKDIRHIESGRTGGTNAMRAAGAFAGIATGVLDTAKATIAVWIAQAALPLAGQPWHIWIHVGAAWMAILGHNYSIFTIRRDEDNRLRFHGGAGGAPTVGGAIGFWWPSVLFIVPVGVMVFAFIGYASVTTMSIALTAIAIFAARAWLYHTPWQYIVFAIVAEGLLLWSLRPNIRRLIAGNERLVGLRAWYRNRNKK
jgi:glycerol-3-phosphate acyltransferase PlsY